jgi:hypothetical protein
MFTKTPYSLLLFLMFATSTFAEIRNFDFKKGNVTVDIPKEWNSVVGYLGIPLTLMGPMKEGSRPLIYVTPTGVVIDKPMDAQKISQTQDEYKQGRENWLKKQNGTAVKYYPYNNLDWPNNRNVHKIGYTYRITKGEFTEYSYYVTCNNKLYHYKSLMKTDVEKEHSQTVDTILQSIKCN